MCLNSSVGISTFSTIVNHFRCLVNVVLGDAEGCCIIHERKRSLCWQLLTIYAIKYSAYENVCDCVKAFGTRKAIHQTKLFADEKFFLQLAPLNYAQIFIRKKLKLSVLLHFGTVELMAQICRKLDEIKSLLMSLLQSLITWNSNKLLDRIASYYVFLWVHEYRGFKDILIRNWWNKSQNSFIELSWVEIWNFGFSWTLRCRTGLLVCILCGFTQNILRHSPFHVNTLKLMK